MTGTNWDEANVLDLLGDSLCRRVLVVASDSPVSATDLTDRLDVSPPTVYRRLDRLVDHELVRERHRVDDGGNHYRTFETRLDGIEVDVGPDGYDVVVSTEDGVADRFGDIWADIGSTAPSPRPRDDSRNTDRRTDTDHSPS